MKNYKLVNTHPVARFYYNGSHSHPVRRTILIIEATDTHIIGYEVREGNVTRQPNSAPIKSYLRRKITKVEGLRVSKKKDYLIHSEGAKKSTLKRSKLYDYLFTGP